MRFSDLSERIIVRVQSPEVRERRHIECFQPVAAET